MPLFAGAQSWEVVRLGLKPHCVIHTLVQTPSCPSSVPSSHVKSSECFTHRSSLATRERSSSFPHTLSPPQGRPLSWRGSGSSLQPPAIRQLGGSSCRKPGKLVAVSTERTEDSGHGPWTRAQSTEHFNGVPRLSLIHFSVSGFQEGGGSPQQLMMSVTGGSHRLLGPSLHTTTRVHTRLLS